MGIYSKLYALRDFQNDTSILSPDTLTNWIIPDIKKVQDKKNSTNLHFLL